MGTCGQDGGIVRNASLPCTTKRRTTTNLKTKTSQNCQKMELYGSLTNKELKKHSSRPVGGAEMGSRAEVRGARWGWLTGKLKIKKL